MVNRLKTVLTTPIPSWVIPICIIGLMVLWIVQGTIQRAEMAAEWKTTDRLPIKSLDSFRQSWSSYDHDTQNAFLESNLRLIHISREAGIVHYPDFSIAMSDLANIKAMRGEYDTAIRLYEEANKNLTKYLGPQHPDVVQIEHNILLVQEIHELP